MYNYDLSDIHINGKSYRFKHNISEVVQYKDTYIVLLEIPFTCDEINNIFCLDENANIKWQSEDLNKKYPKRKNLSYEYIKLKGDIIYATDFFGLKYEIKAKNGKILGYTIVK